MVDSMLTVYYQDSTGTNGDVIIRVPAPDMQYLDIDGLHADPASSGIVNLTAEVQARFGGDYAYARSHVTNRPRSSAGAGAIRPLIIEPQDASEGPGMNPAP